MKWVVVVVAVLAVADLFFLSSDRVPEGPSPEAQLGVTAATLYQWRRRLACDGDGDHEGLPANLVEVTLARSTPSVAEHRLLVRIGDGRRSIEVPRGFDAADLQRLVAALESC